MKKENNQEFYVEQMDVHYPRRSEIQNEIEDIILKGMPQKISILKRIKKIYLGPGLRVIYYKNLSVFFETFIIYFAVCLGLVLSFDRLLENTDEQTRNAFFAAMKIMEKNIEMILEETK